MPLPSGVDLAAFRILQEALTNVIRHSGSREAKVVIEYGAESVALRVDDKGPATAGGDTGGGNGLVGMRERAAALGGSVDAGPRPDGGFRVRASLPLTTAEAQADAVEDTEVEAMVTPGSAPPTPPARDMDRESTAADETIEGRR